MGNFIGQLAQQAAQGALGAGMGILLEGHNDRRQLRQQRALQDIQMEGQRSMTNFNMGKQLEMWDKTNYGAQKDHMIKAGLNPALMYGMSGGGGATTGIQTGNVEGGKAPSGGREVIDSMGIQNQTAQLQLLQAQKENIEADTANKQADTQNKPLQGKNIEASTASLTQGVENAKAQKQLIEIETNLKEIDDHIKGKTQNLAVALITQEVEQSMKTLEILRNEERISSSTIQDKINIVKREAVGMYLRNLQTNEQTKAIGVELAQKWEDIAIKNKQLTYTEWETAIKQQLADYQSTHPNIGQVTGNILDGILKILRIK